ncbi:MAG: GDP-L-fucose synthase [bacterium]|nr:GDP-L-fucose synthase [bacterium]
MNIKVFVAGHKGLAGSAVKRQLEKKGYQNIIFRTRQELDLRNREKVMNFFKAEKPDWVFLAAAKVGGIYANQNYPVDFLLSNLRIQNNVIEAAQISGTEKLLFLGSACIYPEKAAQPLKEDCLLNSKLAPANEPYAIAKIAGIKLCGAFNRQYGTDFLCVMPSNIYGLNDNYHMENAHVIPVLIRRCHAAKINNRPEFTVWGTGSQRREFLYSDDLAEACVFLMERHSAKNIGEIINIGTGSDCSIMELAEQIKDITGYKGNIVPDRSRPDGSNKRLLDISRINQLGWKSTMPLSKGLSIVYKDFIDNENIRK